MPYPSSTTYPGATLYPGSATLEPGTYGYGTYGSGLYGGGEGVTPTPTPEPIPYVPAPGTWAPRVRNPDLTLADPLLFSELVLIERYNQPDTLSITGNLDDLRPTFPQFIGVDGSGLALYEMPGVYLVDDTGRARFSGFVSNIERRGDKTATVTYTGDLQLLWDRICWPTPSAAWTAQTVDAYDTQTAVNETRIINYISRNAGSIAYNGGTFDRRVTGLRLPTSLGRGTSATTTARFENLGQLVAELSEAANLRTRMIYTPEAPSNFIDVIIDDAPDISSWARFGDGYTGGPGLLGEDWRYTLGAGVSAVLSAATGEGTARAMDFLHDVNRRNTWARHVELFIDQRDNTDASEIAEGMATAMAENAPTVDIDAPILAGNLVFGPGEDSVPVGAKVAVNLDGELIYERVRMLTTTVSVVSGQETERVEPTIGTSDAGLTVEQKRLIEALKKLRTLESI